MFSQSYIWKVDSIIWVLKENSDYIEISNFDLKKLDELSIPIKELETFID
ncbi:hypothetical protein [Flavobacterium lindanitolerans]|uniref:Uncharacterized protein n=1 Tax=Flavobacterium lindanitolerans TaxID=428988 RepID=A0A497VCX5_9FLAO|nr:hypothetical protein [Flavobacterium lindanitolerans]MBC8643722.1 hypothetical protein [Flavobacterium lindanitolerans]MDQ7960192.1 hypothetical protein [Flavobacterium lindanitolerans]PKW28476.1 hypothetical protein B0G92_0096 [Flavobacterium lindanitolerans]RLJ36019.1 hypothetical protein CLV50_1408 [Flavobacterium lindanitolerans]